MRSPFKFSRHGKCGAWVSEVMPRLAGVVDDMAFIRSTFTTNLTHEQAPASHSRTLPSVPAVASSWSSAVAATPRPCRRAPRGT
jgi:hypothetical protein